MHLDLNNTLEVNTFDICFAHTSRAHDRRPSKIVYKRPPQLEYDGITLLTNDLVARADLDHIKARYKIGWIFEPPEVKPWIYDKVQSVEHHYDYIFTYDPDRFGNGKYRKFLWGACWIPEDYCKIYDKTKMVSFVCSKKSMTSGHKMRHTVAEQVKDRVDIWGHAYKSFGEDAEGRIAPYAPYRYVIVMENSIYPNYFTEKLIDAFAAGCVPIYRGDPNISEYFDIDGMHTFNTIEELEDILSNKISEQDYLNKMPHIKNNFDNYKKYESPDNYLYDAIKEVLS